MDRPRVEGAPLVVLVTWSAVEDRVVDVQLRVVVAGVVLEERRHDPAVRVDPPPGGAAAPRYVANELAGTHQAANRAQQDAQLRRAEADASTAPDDQSRLHGEAQQTATLAGALEARTAELSELDEARSRWLAHTAGTRAAAERAKAELAACYVDDAEPEQRTTATEWLAAHRAEIADDETHREVTEDDVTDRPNDLHHEHAEVERANEDHDDEDHEVEASGPDIREVAASEPSPVAEDHVRVPSADETSAAVEKANRALAEIRAREDADAREEAEHRAEQLTHWQARDEEVETPDHSNEPVDGTDADFADDLGEVEA